MPPQDSTPLNLPLIQTTRPSTLLKRQPDFAAAERAVAIANAEIGVHVRLSPQPVTQCDLRHDGWGFSIFILPNSMLVSRCRDQPAVFEGGLLRAATRVRKIVLCRSIVVFAFQQVKDQL